MPQPTPTPQPVFRPPTAAEIRAQAAKLGGAQAQPAVRYDPGNYDPNRPQLNIDPDSGAVFGGGAGRVEERNVIQGARIPAPSLPEAPAGPTGGGGGARPRPVVPTRGPWAIDAQGNLIRVAPPQGFISDFPGDDDSESGWMWNPTFQRYQRVQWDDKTTKWTAKDKFQEGPPTDANGRIMPGLPLVGGLEGHYPGEQGYGQASGPYRTENPGIPVFPVANAPRLPSYLSPAQGDMQGQQIPFSNLGIPMLPTGEVGGVVAGGAGTAPAAHTQVEVRSPVGGFGVGVDTASILASVGARPSGDSAQDQARTFAILNRRAELERTGLSTLESSEILRREFGRGKERVLRQEPQQAPLTDPFGMPLDQPTGFAGGGTFTARGPHAVVDMATGRVKAYIGEGPRQERVTIQPTNRTARQNNVSIPPMWPGRPPEMSARRYATGGQFNALPAPYAPLPPSEDYGRPAWPGIPTSTINVPSIGATSPWINALYPETGYAYQNYYPQYLEGVSGSVGGKGGLPSGANTPSEVPLPLPLPDDYWTRGNNGRVGGGGRTGGRGQRTFAPVQPSSR